MALSLGTRLGIYDVTAHIGEGGMGQVFRARDTKLNRNVALKILPDAFASDPDRLARFTREAQTLASLNHPNIAAIYGIEESQDVRALVMELVEGEDLSHRIMRGAIPLDEALPIAKQIAEALETAHEQGIIHRDLKPANVKVREDGTAKVLDFGLAKAFNPAAASSAEVMNSPTLTSPARTETGIVLGTAAYMSPEQARGRPVDRRADIWAFGAVLFEMLAGKRAFPGEDVTDAIVSVISKEPDWSALPAATPTALRRLLVRCLKKDPKARLRDIGEARVQIEELLSGAPEEMATPAFIAAAPAARLLRSVWSRALPWAVASAAVAGLLLVLALSVPWRRTAPPALQRLSVDLGADVSLANTNSGASAILSPDGQTLAFVAQKGDGPSQLYIRRLDQLQAKPLSGTDGAVSPFFSPDGQWVAFFAGTKLKKISVNGGAAVALCEPCGTARGGFWTEDDTIVFQPIVGTGGNLARVSSAGGTPEPLLTLANGEVTQRWPQVLPGGKAVLFTSHTALGTSGSYEDATIVVQPLPSGPRKVIQRGGYYGRYLPSGHVVFIHEGTLFAVPFDLDRLEPAGQPVPALEGVATAITTAGAQFAVSENGTLVYLPGQIFGRNAPISWMDRTGKITPLRAAPSNWNHPSFSPDGRRLAVDIAGGNSDVWIYQWERDGLDRLTFDPAADIMPVWTPDGLRIVFASARGDGVTLNLYWQRADGTGDAQRLTDSKNNQYPASWHLSGKYLAFYESNPQTANDLMILPMEGDEASGWKPGKPSVFLNTTANEIEPMFSKDGRWLAYATNESGPQQVYVRPFPGSGGRQLISPGGGTLPAWSHTKPELFFQSAAGRIMVASYSAEGDAFRPDTPRAWSDAQDVPRQQRSTGLHPDGERFAVAPVPQDRVQAKQDKVVFIFNFFDELRRIAPVK